MKMVGFTLRPLYLRRKSSGTLAESQRPSGCGTETERRFLGCAARVAIVITDFPFSVPCRRRTLRGCCPTSLQQPSRSLTRNWGSSASKPFKPSTVICVREIICWASQMKSRICCIFPYWLTNWVCAQLHRDANVLHAVPADIKLYLSLKGNNMGWECLRAKWLGNIYINYTGSTKESYIPL